MTSIPKPSFIQKLTKFFSQKWRSILYGLIIFFSILFFVYAIGFSTNLAKAENTGSANIRAIVTTANNMTNEMVMIGVVAIVMVLLNIFVGSHNRKKYYWSNYTYLGILLVSLAYGAIRMFQNVSQMVATLEESFAGPDHTRWTILFIRNQRPDLTLESIIEWFEFGYVVGALALLGVIAIASMIMVAVFELPKILMREKYVEDRLRKIEAGEIQVTEKVVNMVPTLDVELDLQHIDDFEKGSYNKVEKMRYQKNNIGFSLALFSLVFFLYGLFMTITYDTFLPQNDRPRVIPTEHVALDIVISILLTLVTFLAAEKIKTYHKAWGYVLLGVAAVNILRIFYIPLGSLSSEAMPFDYFLFQVLIPMILSIGLVIAAAIISIDKSRKVHAFLKGIGEE